MADTDGFLVSHNHVHDGDPKKRGGEGICIKDGSRNGLVHDNHVHHIPQVGLYVDAWDKPTHDIEGRKRPCGKGVGTGAYEAGE